jgi:hypothetical protein
MSFLKKLPNSRRYPHGLEWRILKNTPLSFLSSALVIGLFTLGAHLFPPDGTAQELLKYFELVNILAIATLITAWTAIFTVAIGAIVVYLMKGPAYVWDPLELIDADEPES